ncbi:MAG: hypothetical protein KatS3mg115_1803 [Candidatus Poribacteria bacterium]|nr:MAG: hypothetical protein KatS3mg115_1803 [Candidatus Poribacteria bacterium]
MLVFYLAWAVGIAALLAGMVVIAAVKGRELGRNPALRSVPVRPVDPVQLRRAEDVAIVLLVAQAGLAGTAAWTLRRPSPLGIALVLAWILVQAIFGLRGLPSGMVSSPRAVGIVALFLGAQLVMGTAFIFAEIAVRKR